MHRAYQRTPNSLLREGGTSRLNRSALGPTLQPVMEESLEESGKSKYRKGAMLTVYIVLRSRFGVIEAIQRPLTG